MSRRADLFPKEAQTRWRELEWEILLPEPQSPAMNLALDETLTARVGAGVRRPTLRIWSWSSPCIVIGRFQSVANEINVEGASEHGLQIVRRISGGGAMVIEPGSAVTYSVYVPLAFVRDLSFQESYAFFDSWVLEVLLSLGIDAWYEPLNDITSSSGKIGGAAQARKYSAVLHHTTMAYDMSPGLISTVLRIGQEKLSDKGLRSADKRVGPLRQQTNMPRDEIIDRLIDHFAFLTAARDGRLSDEERVEAEELAAEKFANPDWTHLLP
jgi:lipoate-protein ligase A